MITIIMRPFYCLQPDRRAFCGRPTHVARRNASRRGLACASSRQGEDATASPSPPAGPRMPIEAAPGQQQGKVEPEISTHTAEASAEAVPPPPQQQAWQVVGSYVRSLEHQATRSPGAALTTAASVAFVAMVAGTALRRLLFRPSQLRGPTVEELLEEQGLPPSLQQPALEPSRPAPAAASQRAAPAAATTAAADRAAGPVSSQAATSAAGGLGATLETPELSAGAAMAAGAAATSAVPLSPTPANAGAAAAAYPPLGPPASESPAAQAMAAPQQPVPAGVPSHPLAALEKVYVLRRKAPPSAGNGNSGARQGPIMRLAFEVDYGKERCMVLFEEPSDAEVLLPQLELLCGLDLGDLFVSSELALPMLRQAARENQALAFFPGGSLSGLAAFSMIVRDDLEELLQDEHECEAFEESLQRALQEQAEVLLPEELLQLVGTVSSSSGSGASTNGGSSSSSHDPSGIGAGPSERGVGTGVARPSGSNSLNGSRGTAEAPGLPGEQGAAAEQRSRAGQEEVGGAAQQKPLQDQQDQQRQASQAQQQGQQQQEQAQQQQQPMGELPLEPGWWLQLPVVHVPQLCYEGGASGLMIVPVASLSGALKQGASSDEGQIEAKSSSKSSSKSSNSDSGSGGTSGGSAGQGQPGQQQYSRPVERHVVAFQDLHDAKALSLCALQAEQTGAAVRVQTLAMPPEELLHTARAGGCSVAVLPRGALRSGPRDSFEEVVVALHDAVQDMYWQLLAAGLQEQK